MEGRANPEWPDVGQARWRTLGELVQARQYEQVAEFLHQAQGAGERGGDTILTHALAVACDICLACEQCRAEVEWHRRAHEEANQRVQSLHQKLCAILDLIGGCGPSGASEGRVGPPVLSPVEVRPLGHRAHESARRIGLWQCIRSVLRSRRLPQPPGWASPAASTGPAAPISAYGARGEQTSPSLVVYCLGPFRVYQDDQPVADWPSSKGKCIFKYLVTHRERPVAKEVLMELLWPGAHPDAARNNLNVAVYGLRQALREARPSFSHVLFQDDCYLLNPDLQIWVDVEEFTERFTAAQTLERRGKSVLAIREYRAAEALYQGEFLEEDRYADWPILLRQSLRDDYLSLLDHLSRYYLEQGDDAACVTLCRRMLVVDPCREEAHRCLMRCYSWQGQPYLALRQYHLCVETLQKELDVPPMDETLTLYRRIRAGEAV